MRARKKITRGSSPSVFEQAVNGSTEARVATKKKKKIIKNRFSFFVVLKKRERRNEMAQIRIRKREKAKVKGGKWATWPFVG